MFNYLKWELKDFLLSSYKWLVACGVIFLLCLIFPFNNDNVITRLLMLSYTFAITFAMLGSFYAGTKRVVSTYNKKTFLLESMIPVSVKKILLAKYLLGIIINSIFILTTMIGVLILILKGIGVENTLDFLADFIANIDFIKFIEALFNLFFSSVAFLSVVVLCFVTVKAFRPEGKRNSILGVLLAYFVIYFLVYFVSIVTPPNILILYLEYICISAVAFFATAYLIEEKLEIY